jgi:hypothetical protein
MTLTFFDGLFLFIAILLNILIIIIFIVRYRGPEGLEHKIGYFVIACAVPLAIILINYILVGVDLWIIIYITLIISFLIFEAILDYIIKLNFRTNPKIAVPYVLFYYIAFWGLLAISFVIQLVFGFIVFGFFTLNVIITIYTHRKDKNRMVLRKDNEKAQN